MKEVRVRAREGSLGQGRTVTIIVKKFSLKIDVNQIFFKCIYEKYT